MELVKTYKGKDIYKAKYGDFCYCEHWLDKNLIDLDYIEEQLSERDYDLYIENAEGLRWNCMEGVEQWIDNGYWEHRNYLEEFSEIEDYQKVKIYEDMKWEFENDHEQFEKNYL